MGWQWGITPQRGGRFSDPASQGPLSVLGTQEGPAAVLGPHISLLSWTDALGTQAEFILTSLSPAPHTHIPWAWH